MANRPNILVGFNLSATEPLDIRNVATNEADRLSRQPFNCYKGLSIFQQDTNELYVCIDPDNPSSNDSWAQYEPSFGPNFTSARVNDNFTISGSTDITGSLSVQDTLLINGPNASLQVEGTGDNDLFLITSGNNATVSVNSTGLIVIDDFTYTPPATVGGILFSGSEFYAGL